MHPSFKQSVAYMVPKQEQCVSDIIEVAPANHFPISSDMVSSDMVASWCLKRQLITGNTILNCTQATWFSSIVMRRIVVHLNRSGNALSHLRG